MVTGALPPPVRLHVTICSACTQALMFRLCLTASHLLLHQQLLMEKDIETSAVTDVKTPAQGKAICNI